MRDIFQFQQNENYNLRSGTHLDSNKMRTTLFGKETLSKAEVKIWSLLPKELRNALSLQVFKNKLKEWKPKLLYVGFVRHKFITSALPKLASYENYFYSFYENAWQYC